MTNSSDVNYNMCQSISKTWISKMIVVHKYAIGFVQ
jgi:hypothetical protein